MASLYDVTSDLASPSIKVILPSGLDWRSNNVIIDETPIYTDTSVNRDIKRTGIGIFSDILRIRYSGFAVKLMNSYKAEMLTINSALTLDPSTY